MPISADEAELKRRVERWADLQEYIHPVPEAWIIEAQEEKKKASVIQVEECTSYEDLEEAWRSAMVWTKELDGALCFMLAVCLSTDMPEDQLWGKVISVPSSGKTVLAEALSVCRQYVYPKDYITKFFSGMQDKSGKDTSILPKIRGKTLITKDGDTLLQAPDRAVILAQARSIYDKAGRTHYNTRKETDYENNPFTWLLMGTQSLRQIDTSELGERFIDYVIVDRIDDETESKICDRVINRLFRYRAVRSNGTAQSSKTPEMVRAQALTGGYLKYLRDNYEKVLSAVKPCDKAGQKCKRLANFVSYMRSKPDKSKEAEDVNREMSARLVCQLTKLALCVAAVKGSESMDAETMKIVSKVALDTSRGRPLDLVQYLHKQGSDGVDAQTMGNIANVSDDRMKALIRHLIRNRVIESISHGFGKRYKLTSVFTSLYREVHAKL